MLNRMLAELDYSPAIPSHFGEKLNCARYTMQVGLATTDSQSAGRSATRVQGMPKG
jgi:hypothetical protein